MNKQIIKRLKRTAMLAAVFFVIGMVLGLFSPPDRDYAARTHKTTPVAGIRIGGPFTLTDQNGNRVTEKIFVGKYVLVYFGFTSCPAICPTELAKITKTLNALGPAAEKIQPVFITVDPERDTPDVLKNYLTLFHPRLISLTGTPAEIEAVLKSYKIFATKRQDPGASDYTMDHSSFIYFIAPDGDLLSIYRTEDTADVMAGEIEEILKK